MCLRTSRTNEESPQHAGTAHSEGKTEGSRGRGEMGSRRQMGSKAPDGGHVIPSAHHIQKYM